MMKTVKQCCSSCLLNTGPAYVRKGNDNKICDIYNIIDPVTGLSNRLVCRWPAETNNESDTYYRLDETYTTGVIYHPYFAK